MIYILNVVFEVFLGIVFLNSYAFSGLGEYDLDYQNQKKQYVVSCCILWILISGLRSLQIGADTTAYFNSFESIKHYPLSIYLEEIYKKYILGMSVRDPGYNVLVKLFHVFSQNYQIYLLFVACVFMIPFARWIIVESKNPVISYVLFSSLFYAFFAITGIRQTISTTLVVLIGDKYIKERRLVPFVILVLIASSIHASALVFLPFYFISVIPINGKTISVWGIVFLAATLRRNQLKNFFISVSEYDMYANNYEGGGTPTFTVLLLLLFIWAVVACIIDKEKKENARYYNALGLALFFLPLTWLNPSAMRIVQYFSIYLVLLIPEMVEVTFTPASKRVAAIAIIGILIFLLVKSNPYYSFFWSGV